jgi:hypothetical protein
MSMRISVLALTFLGFLPASAQQVELQLEDTLTVRDAEIRYALDLDLSAMSSTRVDVQAVLDLRDLQERLPSLMADATLVDGCANELVVRDVALTARDSIAGLSGSIRARVYRCERESESAFRRGDLLAETTLRFTAEATTDIQENCAVFRVAHLDMRRPTNTEAGDSENLEAARALVLEAANLILADTPLCLDLPPELASLDPRFSSAGPQVIGDGGFGIALSGSIDVSARTILDILRVLQSEGAVPGPP